MPIEAKYRQQRQVPNRLKVMLTTNHDHAIAAGMNSRRFFVCDVSDEKAQDKSWFDPLYDDLKNGGTAEFLNFLLSLRLGDWHPRAVPKTNELAQQQIMSAGSVEQWLLACCEIDGLLGATCGGGLNAEVPTQTLYEAYSAHTKTRGLRPDTVQQFGRVITDLFGPSRRLPATQGSTKRHPGYFIPDAKGMDAAVRQRLKTSS
jgi:hypothetical protein